MRLILLLLCGLTAADVSCRELAQAPGTSGTRQGLSPTSPTPHTAALYHTARTRPPVHGKMAETGHQDHHPNNLHPRVTPPVGHGVTRRGPYGLHGMDTLFGTDRHTERVLVALSTGNTEWAWRSLQAARQSARMSEDTTTPTPTTVTRSTAPHLTVGPGSTAPHLTVGPGSTAPHLTVGPGSTAPHLTVGPGSTAPHLTVGPGSTAPHLTVGSGSTAPHLTVGPGSTAPHLTVGPGSTAPHLTVGPGSTAPHLTVGPGSTAPHLTVGPRSEKKDKAEDKRERGGGGVGEGPRDRRTRQAVGVTVDQMCSQTYTSCAGRCGRRERVACSCDVMCPLYRDCCEDIVAFCAVDRHHTPTNIATTTFNENTTTTDIPTTTFNINTTATTTANKHTTTTEIPTPTTPSFNIPTTTNITTTTTTTTSFNNPTTTAIKYTTTTELPTTTTTKTTNNHTTTTTTTPTTTNKHAAHTEGTASRGEINSDIFAELRLLDDSLRMECIQHTVVFRGCASNPDDLDLTLLRPFGLTLTAGEVRERCLREGEVTSLHDVVLVQGTRPSGVTLTFRNVFCAVCSGVSLVRELTLTLRCLQLVETVTNTSLSHFLDTSGLTVPGCSVYWAGGKSCLPDVPLPSLAFPWDAPFHVKAEKSRQVKGTTDHPPPETDDNNADNKTDHPTPETDDNNADNETDLPPPETDDTNADNETDHPTPETDDNNADNETDLPPPETDDNNADNETDLPPPETDDTNADNETDHPTPETDDNNADNETDHPTPETDDNNADNETDHLLDIHGGVTANDVTRSSDATTTPETVYSRGSRSGIGFAATSRVVTRPGQTTTESDVTPRVSDTGPVPESASSAVRKPGETRSPVDVGSDTSPGPQTASPVETWTPPERWSSERLRTLCESHTSYVLIEGRVRRNKYCYLLTDHASPSARCVPLTGMRPSTPFFHAYRVQRVLTARNVTKLAKRSQPKVGTVGVVSGAPVSPPQPINDTCVTGHVQRNATCVPVMYVVHLQLHLNFTAPAHTASSKSAAGHGDLNNFKRHLVDVMDTQNDVTACTTKDSSIKNNSEASPHEWSQLMQFSCHVTADETSRLDVFLKEMTSRLKASFDRVVELIGRPADIKTSVCIIPQPLTTTTTTSTPVTTITTLVTTTNTATHFTTTTAIPVTSSTTTPVTTNKAYCSESSLTIVARVNGRVSPSSITVQGYVTIVCCLLSDVGLFLRITLQCVIPFYNSFPGRIQFCLCLSLLLAYTLFLIGGIVAEGSQSCRVIGVVTHLALLSALFWMNITAYEIWWTFRDWKSQVTKRGHASLLVRALVAIGVPLVLVGVALVMDRAWPDSGLSPHYGTPHCWLNQPHAIIAFFVLPCSLICLVNSVFAACTVRSLRRQKSAMANLETAGTVSPVNDIAISFKIVVLVGVTWLLGLVAALLDTEALWLLFTAVNASLGFLIAAVLMCNHRVLSVLRRAIRPPPPDRAVNTSTQLATLRGATRSPPPDTASNTSTQLATLRGATRSPPPDTAANTNQQLATHMC